MVRIDERRTIGAVQSGLAALIVLGYLPSFEPPCSHRFYQAINFTTTSAFWSLQSAPRIPEPHHAKFVSCETSPLPPGSDSTTTCVGQVKATSYLSPSRTHRCLAAGVSPPAVLFLLLPSPPTNRQIPSSSRPLATNFLLARSPPTPKARVAADPFSQMQRNQRRRRYIACKVSAEYLST